MRTIVDPWEQQRKLAKTTVAWSIGSLAAGTAWATRRDRWWRSFGQQHIGWGLVDLGIVAIVQGLQHREMNRLLDPYDADVVDRRRRHLCYILIGNAIADAGYVLMGAAMWRRLRHNPRAAGAGAAIIVQGLFLLVHDSHHARVLRTPRAVDGARVDPR